MMNNSIISTLNAQHGIKTAKMNKLEVDGYFALSIMNKFVIADEYKTELKNQNRMINKG